MDGANNNENRITVGDVVNILRLGVDAYEEYQSVAEPAGASSTSSGARNDSRVTLEKAVNVAKIGITTYDFCQSVQEGIESAKRGETEEWFDDGEYDKDPSMQQMTKMIARDAYRMYMFFQGEPSRGLNLDNDNDNDNGDDEYLPTTGYQRGAVMNNTVSHPQRDNNY